MKKNFSNSHCVVRNYAGDSNSDHYPAEFSKTTTTGESDSNSNSYTYDIPHSRAAEPNTYNDSQFLVPKLNANHYQVERSQFPTFFEDIAQQMTDIPDVHQAFGSLPSSKIEKIICLIQALKQIERADEMYEAKGVAYWATQYLKHRLGDIERNCRPVELLEADPGHIIDGIQLHSQILSLSSNRRKELLELGYFLKGELHASERVENLKRILCSYLRAINR